ncbi:MAG: type II toxin-antitoxin system RelE/ParE family toxin [Acetobacteraceae bacterium]|nr:type II toxin-antitoxin system RelE/ParE family toxin [Acetobacteraceae bacterium]
MTRIVRFSRQGGRDLNSVRAWFTQPGAGPRAQRRLAHIERSILELANHPCRHPREPHGWREFTIEEHRVRYRVSRDTGRDTTAGNVLVLRIFGPGQDRSRT